MISEECLTIEWIKTASAQNINGDKILVEKAIRALRLLEGLVEENVEFVFKGGTSLMLLLESTKRLSIDIDIVIENKVDLKKQFANIVKIKGFTRFELQERGKSSHIDKAHYKFYYKPAYKISQEEEYILSDVRIALEAFGTFQGQLMMVDVGKISEKFLGFMLIYICHNNLLNL